MLELTIPFRSSVSLPAKVPSTSFPMRQAATAARAPARMLWPLLLSSHDLPLPVRDKYDCTYRNLSTPTTAHACPYSLWYIFQFSCSALVFDVLYTIPLTTLVWTYIILELLWCLSTHLISIAVYNLSWNSRRDRSCLVIRNDKAYRCRSGAEIPNLIISRRP